MLCCSVVGYCYSFKVYQGKKWQDKTDTDDSATAMEDENTTGPIALMHSYSWMKDSHRTVFCDCYYTSVSLFLQLNELGINACRTIQPNCWGYTELVKMDKSEASKIERGSLRMAKHKLNDGQHLVAMS